MLKFDLVHPLKILNLFRRIKKKLTACDIEMACYLFNNCGKYLFNHPASNIKAKLFLESLFRIKSRIPTQRDLCALIDDTYFRIFPPKDARLVNKRSYTVLQRFIQHICYERLESNLLDRVLLFWHHIHKICKSNMALLSRQSYLRLLNTHI